MSTAVERFRAKAPGVMTLLMSDFELTDIQAAGICGNFGAESGLAAVQEKNPTSGRGGFGWAQWTGPRRVQFEAYCSRNHLDPLSDKANYGWLFTELKGSEKAAIAALKKTTALKDAVRAFEKAYERAGVKAYASRDLWAQRALDAFRAASGDDEIRRVQQALVALELDDVVGPVDGILGDKTKKAVRVFQRLKGLTVDGIPGPETKAALFPRE